jgi:hypothetical protein
VRQHGEADAWVRVGNVELFLPQEGRCKIDDAALGLAGCFL